MSGKVFRLKVKRIPLNDDITYKRPNFPQFNDLHMDLLENKTKLKKSPPKPIFVRTERTPPLSNSEKFKGSNKSTKSEEDLTLDELEKVYSKYNDNDNDIDNDEVYSIKSGSEKESHADLPEHYEETRKPQYTHEDFARQAEENIDEETKEKQEKDELLFNFMVLRRKYPNVDIPEFTEHSDINTMRRAYDQILRKVSLDSSVDNYKKYLIGGFAVLEWVSTNWLGIDLSGLTQNQIAGMNSYERLLVELGEKNFSVQGSRFPVEVRLLFMMLFNAGLFYIQKMLYSGGASGGNGGGFNIMNMFFGGGTTNQNQSQPQKKRRRPMGGPTITPEDVDKLSREQDSEHEKDD